MSDIGVEGWEKGKQVFVIRLNGVPRTSETVIVGDREYRVHEVEWNSEKFSVKLYVKQLGGPR